jgi:hypothetical protein
MERVTSKTVDRLRPTAGAFLIKAVGLALVDYGYANRRPVRGGFGPFRADRLDKFPSRDVAVAMDRDVPGVGAATLLDIVRGADALPLSAINIQLAALSETEPESNPAYHEAHQVVSRYPAWLAGRILRRRVASASGWVERRGGAVLVTSPKFGVDRVLVSSSYPIALSYGTTKRRAIVVDGKVEARLSFHLGMVFDRRLMTVSQAARFFQRIVTILEAADLELAPFLSPEAQPDAPQTRVDFPTAEVTTWD